MSGAKIPNSYLRPGFRKDYQMKRCAVCNKHLMRHNKKMLCCVHSQDERILNYKYQGFNTHYVQESQSK